MMTGTLVAVNPPSKDEESGSVHPSEQELEAARGLVRQARDRGVALTGPGGSLKALAKMVIETGLPMHRMMSIFGTASGRVGRTPRAATAVR